MIIRTIMIGETVMEKGSHIFLRVICLSFVLLLGFILGCSNRIDVPVVKTYQAYISNSVRTSMEDNGDVSWTQGDNIWYFSQDGGELRNYVTEEGGAKIDIPLIIAPDATYVTAIYGTSIISNHTGETLSLGNVVKPVQDGSFFDGHVAVARLTDVDGPTLRFHNLVSYIIFSTELTGIDHVVFSASDDSSLHSDGNVDVRFEDDIPVPSLSGNGKNSIRINLHGAGTYCIAVLPVSLCEGFTLFCYDSEEKLVGTATGKNALAVHRGSIIRLGRIDSHLVDGNGIHLGGYDDDHSWDYSGNTNGDIGLGGYLDDVNWGSAGNNQGSFGIGWFSEDYNWDDGQTTSGDIDRQGYGDDKSWN
jgi:hypothetical protein